MLLNLLFAGDSKVCFDKFRVNLLNITVSDFLYEDDTEKMANKTLTKRKYWAQDYDHVRKINKLLISDKDYIDELFIKDVSEGNLIDYKCVGHYDKCYDIIDIAIIKTVNSLEVSKKTGKKKNIGQNSMLLRMLQRICSIYSLTNNIMAGRLRYYLSLYILFVYHKDCNCEPLAESFARIISIESLNNKNRKFIIREEIAMYNLHVLEIRMQIQYGNNSSFDI